MATNIQKTDVDLYMELSRLRDFFKDSEKKKPTWHDVAGVVLKKSGDAYTQELERLFEEAKTKRNKDKSMGVMKDKFLRLIRKK